MDLEQSRLQGLENLDLEQCRGLPSNPAQGPRRRAREIIGPCNHGPGEARSPLLLGTP